MTSSLPPAKYFESAIPLGAFGALVGTGTRFPTIEKENQAFSFYDAYYSFSIAKNNTYVWVPSTSAVSISIYDANHNLVTSQYQSQGSVEAISAYLNTGSYFLKVSNASAGFSFALTARPRRNDGVDLGDAGNSVGTALDLGSLSYGRTTVTHAEDLASYNRYEYTTSDHLLFDQRYSDPIDFYKFTVGSAGRVKFDLSGTYGGVILHDYARAFHYMINPGSIINLQAGTYYLEYLDSSFSVPSATVRVDYDRDVVDRYSFNLSFLGGRPDLTASIDSVSATTVKPGDTLNIGFRLANSGGASGTDYGIYLSSDASIGINDRLLSWGSLLNAIGVGGSINLNASLALPNLAPGTYYLGVIVDHNGRIVETNDGNNASAPIKITVTANFAPLVTAAATVATGHSTPLAATSLFTASDPDGTVRRYAFLDATTAVGSGHFEVAGVAKAAGVWFGVDASQLDQIRFVTGLADDTIQVKAFDGVSWSATKSIKIDVPLDLAPTITIPDTTIEATAKRQVFQATSLFAASDPDGDALTYLFRDLTPGLNSGHFYLNGIKQAEGEGTFFKVTASQLAGLTFVGGIAGTDVLGVAANDGLLGTGWKALTIKAPPNHAPVVMVADPTVEAGLKHQTFTAAQLFSATDTDGDALSYLFRDLTAGANSGHFYLNGVKQAEGDGTYFKVSADQLAGLTFVSGLAGKDAIGVAAHDGLVGSGWTPLTVAAPPNHAPAVTVPDTSLEAASPRQMFDVQSLFSASDADGDALSFTFRDLTAGLNSGHFYLNGVRQPEGVGTSFKVAGTQLDQLTFVAAQTGTDSIGVLASDGLENSGWTNMTVWGGGNHAPSLVIDDPSLVARYKGEVWYMEEFVSATDADGDALTFYFKDLTVGGGSGQFFLNGRPQVEGAANVITLPADQLDHLTFYTRWTGVTDTIQVLASDGKLNTGWQTVTFTAASNTAPEISAPDTQIHKAPGTAVDSRLLFDASDADNDSLAYFFRDATVGASSGHFVLKGVQQAEGTAVLKTSYYDMFDLDFVTGTGAGIVDTIYARVWDGLAYSDWVSLQIGDNPLFDVAP